MSRVGAFPGTFNPPTVAHLAAADAARDRHGLDRVDLVVSRVPLVKGAIERPTLDERVEVLRRVARRVGWLGVVVTDHQLIVDLAHGYDVVVMGADKWHQIHDPVFYGGSPEARDEALSHLPPVAVVPRAGFHAPHHLALDIHVDHHDVSSTRARAGEHHLMLPEALDSCLWGNATG